MASAVRSTAISASVADLRLQGVNIDHRNVCGSVNASRNRANRIPGALSNSLMAIKNGRLRCSKVDRRAVLQTSQSTNDRPDGATHQVVPHEPEPAYARIPAANRSAQGDAAEVHRHRGVPFMGEWPPACRRWRRYR